MLSLHHQSILKLQDNLIIAKWTLGWQLQSSQAPVRLSLKREPTCTTVTQILKKKPLRCSPLTSIQDVFTKARSQTRGCKRKRRWGHSVPVVVSAVGPIVRLPVCKIWALRLDTSVSASFDQIQAGESYCAAFPSHCKCRSVTSCSVYFLVLRDAIMRGFLRFKITEKVYGLPYHCVCSCVCQVIRLLRFVCLYLPTSLNLFPLSLGSLYFSGNLKASTDNGTQLVTHNFMLTSKHNQRIMSNLSKWNTFSP